MGRNGKGEIQESEVFFLYEDILQELITSHEQKVYIFGGRGVGKSILLKQLKERLEDGSLEVIFINGRDQKAAIEELKSRADSNERSFHLLMDDVDIFFRNLLATDTDNLQKFKDSLRYIDSLIKSTSVQNAKIVLSGSSKPAQMLTYRFTEKQKAVIDQWKFFWSFILNAMVTVRCDPWEGDWEKKLENFMLSKFKKSLGKRLDIWFRVIRDLTGGHPTLLHPALHKLNVLLQSPKRTPLEEKLIKVFPNLEEADVERMVRNYLEDVLINTGLQKIRRTIYELREHPEPEYQKAFKLLQNIARHGTSQLQASREFFSHRIREILEDMALLYKDFRDGSYRIPGELIVQEILSFEPPVLAQRVLTLIPDKRTPDKKGRARIENGHTTQEIPLTGGPWKILKVLSESPQKVVSLEELEQRAGMTSQDAVRSALQRLEKKFREIQIEKVVENLRGRGYRLTIAVGS